MTDAAKKAADERETERVRYERLFLGTRDENEDLHDEVGTLKDDLDQARKDLETRTKERDDVKDDRTDWIDRFVEVLRVSPPSAASAILSQGWRSTRRRYRNSWR